MTSNAQQVLANALNLPPNERAQLAEQLFASLAPCVRIVVTSDEAV